jgi:hypothetical protein
MGSNPILAASFQQSPLGGLAVLQVDVVQGRGEPVRAAGVGGVVVAPPGD